jgi:hypothetical protein
MIKSVHWVLAGAMVLLGVAHSFIAFYCREPDADMLWFLGAGIAIILAGLFNALFLLVNAAAVKVMTLVVNTLMAGLFIFALTVLSGAQVYAGISLFVVAAILILLDPRRKSRATQY